MRCTEYSDKATEPEMLSGTIERGCHESVFIMADFYLSFYLKKLFKMKSFDLTGFKSTPRMRGAIIFAALVFLVDQTVAEEIISDIRYGEIRAQLTPLRHTTLSTELPLKIKAISVREGESFKDGQVLVEFDCVLQLAQLKEGQAELSIARKVDSANRKLLFNRAVGLLEVQQAEAELLKAQARVDALLAVISKCKIKAPFAGRVVTLGAQSEQFVQPGTPLLEIIDDSAFEIDFLVPSNWIAWLKPQYQFQIQIHETGQTYTAQVQRLGAKVDPVSRSIKVAAKIVGNRDGLIAGMSGYVLIDAPQ